MRIVRTLVLWVLGALVTLVLAGQAMAWLVVLCPRVEVQCIWE